MGAEASETVVLGPGLRAYTVALLLAITFVSFLDRQVLTILIEPIKRDLGLSDTQIGALTGLFFSLFYALAGLPMARLADTHNRRKVMSACIAGWSFATAASGMAQNFVHLAIARTMVGIGDAGCSPAGTAIIGDLFPAERRAPIISANAAASAVGIGFSLFLGGLLVEHVGWRMVMFILSLPGFAIALLVLMTMPDAPRPTHAGPPPPLFATVGELWRIPTYRALLVIIFCASASGFAMMAWIATLLIRVDGMAPSKVGLTVGTCLTVGLVVGNAVCGFLAHRLGARDSRWLLRLLGGSLLLNVPLGLVSFFTHDPTVAILAFGLLMTSGGFWAPLAYTSGIGLVGPQIRAVTASTLTIVLSIGGAAGPFAVGLFNDLLAPRFGVDSIRYSMAALLGGYLIAGLAGFAALGQFRNDYLPDRSKRMPPDVAEEFAAV